MNPRLLKEATALSSSGFDVTVVRGRYSAWGEQQDLVLALPEWHVHSVPFGPEQHPKHQYIRQALLRRGARFALRLGLSNPAVEECAHAPIVGDLAAYVSRLPKADLYIAHYVAALPAAARAAKNQNTLFAFDAEDFHAGDGPDVEANKFDRMLIGAIERRYLPQAAYVTAASPGIADAYAAEYGIERPTVVLNTFPRAQAPAAPTSRGEALPGPSLYWFSQTIGPNRGLECAVRAISIAASAPHLYLRGKLAQGFGAALTALAREARVADRLHFLEPAPPQEMERLAAKYDLGLASEIGETKSRRLALTNKLFTYLQAGVPAVLSDIPAHRDFVAELEDGAFLYKTEDADSLAAVIDLLLLHPGRLAAARLRAFQSGQTRFNWDREQNAFLACVRNFATQRKQ